MLNILVIIIFLYPFFSVQCKHILFCPRQTSLSQFLLMNVTVEPDAYVALVSTGRVGSLLAIPTKMLNE
jgi:hypothetical protein